jgi:hypothetical protein
MHAHAKCAISRFTFGKLPQQSWGDYRQARTPINNKKQLVDLSRLGLSYDAMGSTTKDNLGNALAYDSERR